MTPHERDCARLEVLARAIERLGAALRQPRNEWTRDAAIQRFEFTFELAWKSVVRAVRREGLECASPRQAFGAALSLGWIADDTVWLDMLEDRNRTTHTYDEATAEEIRARLPAYLEVLTELLAVLRAKMADRGSAP